MIPCLFRRMAPHIDPPPPRRTKTPCPTHFSQLLSPTAYHFTTHTPESPSIFSTSIPSIFHQFSTTFSNFSGLMFAFSTTQPLAPKRPNIHHPIFQRAHQQPSPPKLAPFSLQRLNRFCHLLHQPFKNCTPKSPQIPQPKTLKNPKPRNKFKAKITDRLGGGCCCAVVDRGPSPWKIPYALESKSLNPNPQNPKP